MRSRVVLLLLVVLVALPLWGDIFGPPPQPKRSVSVSKAKKEQIKLLGVLIFEDARYAFLQVGGRVFFLKEGQGTRYKLVKVVDSKTACLQVGRRKLILKIKEGRKWKRLKKPY